MGTVMIPFLVNRSIQYLYGHSHDSIPCQQVNPISIWVQSWFHSLSTGQSNIYMGTVLIPFLVNRSIQYLHGYSRDSIPVNRSLQYLHMGTVVIPFLVNRSIQYLHGYSRDYIPCQQVNPISTWVQLWFHSLSTGQSNIYMGTVVIPFLSTDQSNIYTWVP